ncbi:ABC transporter ATP-binding protein/permease [bacterium]|nr:ABC transporter ATP-binding protein/permease [bacterium]
MIPQLKFIFGYLKQHKFSYIAGVFFIILTNLISVTIPEYLKLSIDLISKYSVSLQDNQSQLFRYLLIMLLLAISIVFVRALSRIFFFNPGRAIEYKIKNDLFAKLTQLQKDYYDKNPTGGIISRIQNDINGVRLICGFGMMQMFNIATALSLTPYKMWQLSPQLTLYIVVPILIVFVIIRIGMHFVTRNMRTRMVALQNLSSFVVSSLSGIDIIKGFNLFDWNVAKLNQHNSRMLKLSLRISFFRSFLMPVLQNLENILKIIILSIGGYYVINAGFTIGELTAFMAYSALLSMPIMGLGWLTTIIQTGLVGLTSIETIISQKTDKIDLVRSPKSELSGLFNAGIEVKNLKYSYPGSATPVLKDISFTIMPDQTVGILGKIGSGKTTLVNCLNRYFSVPDGSIFVGGKDINSFSRADIRHIVRTVSQDVFLFSDTILCNILFGAENEEEITQEITERIVFEAALKDEIDRFPNEYETMIGERGIMLSGGQKQRISLARSMMAPHDLLILDNVLSAVDNETERFLLKHIMKRRTARSLLIVSHRVQALEEADLILVLDEGRIADSGTHKELINQPGLYYETWCLQEQGK